MGSDILTDLNPQQLQAVTHTEGPLLIVAGPGSGKTRVITQRIAYLLDMGIDPESILAVSFTNKAAQEMRSRVNQCSKIPMGRWIGTFHSVCVRILRNHIHRLGVHNNFVIYDTQDQIHIVKESMKALNINEKDFRPQAVLSAISNAKNKLMTVQAFEEQIGDYFQKRVSEVYKLYQKKLHENHALDFDDIILKTVQLFSQETQILELLQNQFHYIMVDEYQDTNYAQYCFIEMLSRRYRNICVVGDPDQSIYGWRGADIGNILKFEEDNPEAVRVTLEQNYRSTKYILDAANHLVRNNRLRKEKNLWTDNEEGEPIGCYCGSNEYEEVDFVVHMIERLKRDRAIQYHDMVIFYRMHAISRVFEESLRRADIPYQIIGGIGFYQRKEVKDIIAYLRLIDGSSDPVSFKRIINIPPKGIGAVTINKIEGYAQTRAKNIMEVLEENTPIPGISAKLQQHLHGFASLISYFKKQKELLHLPDLIMHLIERINFFEELKKEDKVMADARIANVKELVSAAEEYVLMHEEADLSGFLEGVVLATDLDKLSESDDSISLMTLHNAKGLEFEVVFMVALEDGFFPHGSAFVDDEELEEERRLCYVGMTRAKKKLLMSYSDSRMIYGRRTMTQPSRFLREIPENYMVSQSLFGSDIHHQANTGSSLGKVNSSLKFDYDIGQKVLHPVFGVGEIMELGREDNAVKVRINFENIPSSKWLMAKYARLTPL